MWDGQARRDRLGGKPSRRGWVGRRAREWFQIGWFFPVCWSPKGGVLLDARKYVVHKALQRGRLPLVGDVSEATVVLVVAVLLRGRGTGAGLKLQDVRLGAAAGWRRLSLGFDGH